MKIRSYPLFVMSCSLIFLISLSCSGDSHTEEKLILEETDLLFVTDESSNQNGKEIIEEFSSLVGCYAGINNLDVDIAWSIDCSTASVTLSLCCNCLSTGGPNGGNESSCTLEPGLLTMQTEECPFDFYTYDHNIPEIMIREGNCYEIVFEIENKGCNVVYVNRLWFNGEPFEFSYEQSQSICQ
ncbi:MAG: hypothetical protein Aureis2KO_01690 [Aureisphaera sp.]